MINKNVSFLLSNNIFRSIINTALNDITISSPIEAVKIVKIIAGLTSHKLKVIINIIYPSNSTNRTINSKKK